MEIITNNETKKMQQPSLLVGLLMRDSLNSIKLLGDKSLGDFIGLFAKKSWYTHYTSTIKSPSFRISQKKSYIGRRNVNLR